MSFTCVNYAHGRHPIFTPNKGQFPVEVFAKAQMTFGDFWVCKDGFKIRMVNPDQIEPLHDKSIHQKQVSGYNFHYEFLGLDFKESRFTGTKSSETYNYFKGNNIENRVTGIHRYSDIQITTAEKGVEFEVIASEIGIKYNWIVSNDFSGKIKYIVHGAKVEQISPTEIKFAGGKFQWIERLPLVFDKATGEKINAYYQLLGDTVSVQWDDLINKRSATQIVVDPVLIFSTYTGSYADNFGCTGTYDDMGNGYAGGTVFDFGLPTNSGAFQENFGGGRNEDLGYGGSRDCAILKFNSNGDKLLYCTYLGGNDNEQPHSMVVDSYMNLFVMGTSRSTNFPVSTSAYQKNNNGDYDFFVTSFDSLGNLRSSTLFGGSGLDGVGADRSNRNVNQFPLIYNYADEFRGEIITDNENIYIGGVIYSEDFVHKVDGFNRSWDKNQESNGVVFSFSSDLSKLRWSHIVGTDNPYFDAIYGIALGDSGNLFATGGTHSGFFRSDYGENWINNKIGDVDGILLKLNSETGQFLTGRYYGSASYDQSYFVQTDNSGRPYIFGQTEGQLSNIGATYYDGGTGQFIARFSKDLNSIDLQSTFGANSNLPNISPSAFLVDRCERIFVSGWGGSTNNALYDVTTGASKTHRNKGNTRNLKVSNDAIQKNTDGSDFYVAVFARDMYELAFATFFGGISTGRLEAEEHVDGGTSRFDKKGIIYQSVCAGCRRNGIYPVTPGAYSNKMNSPNCNNALFKIDFENLNKKPFMADTFIEVVATDLIDVTRIANDYDWFDTVRINYRIVDSGGMSGLDVPSFVSSEGIGKADVHLVWQTLCNSWSKDTVLIEFQILDCGCPEADTTYAYFKILVNEPPKVDPPKAICVSYDRQTTEMKISWPLETQSDRFFAYYILEKTNPDGSVENIDTIYNYQAGSFLDKKVVLPNKNNYCYRMIGVNTCGVRVESSNKWCTIRELNDPIESVEMIEARVTLDYRVDLRWEKSKEPDFKEYEVYKYPRGTQPKFIKPDFITTDTFLQDSNLNVDKDAMCYQLLVIDQCGHISSPSNPGCNVIISGKTKAAPDYYFDLDWIDYLGWDSGVQNWSLERMHEGQKWFNSVVINPKLVRDYRDKDLDYNWGGYWYRVTAKKSSVISSNSYNAETESNWIFLIQPPEVWVPDAMTINSDGLNDVWGTTPIFVKGYDMKVYDRWGNKIWQSTAKNRQWDGTKDGKELPDGVYAWQLFFKGWDKKTYRKTGTVILLH